MQPIYNILLGTQKVNCTHWKQEIAQTNITLCTM